MNEEEDKALTHARLSWEMKSVHERLDHIHECFERRDKSLQALIERIADRVTILEKLRERVIGMTILGAVVFVGIAGMLWAFFSRWLPIMDAMGRLIDKVPKP